MYRVIAVNRPKESWVARWQQISGKRYVRGTYAVSVKGSPAKNKYIQEAERMGYRYINRDQSQ